MAALTGNELLQVLPVQANGSPAATTEQVTTGQIAALAGNNPNAPLAVGASATAVFGGKYLLNTAAGSVLTLPAATGTGGSVDAIVITTASSNAHKVLPHSSSDFMQGFATGENAGTAKCFASDGTTNHSIQMPFAGTQPSGGFIGDSFKFTDIGTGLWQVTGSYQAGTTPTTPFSTATT